MKLETFFEKFEQFAEAPNAVAKMRELILHLAVHGKLVEQCNEDEPASTLLLKSRAAMATLMASGQAKKEKPAEPVLETEATFALPSNWTWCRLVDAGQFINGLAFKPSDWGPVGRPIIRIQNLSGRNLEFNRTTGNFDSSVLVQDGDILVSWSATLDAYIWRGEEGVLNQHIFRVLPAPLADKGYIFWLLKWVIRQLAESDHAHGLVMSHINRGPFLARSIPLPPLAEQKRIVAKVDELMALCDQLEAQQLERDTRHAALARASLARFSEALTPANLDYLFHPSYAISPADLRKTILTLAVQGMLVPQDPDDDLAGELAALRAKNPKPSKGDRDAPFELPTTWQWMQLGQVSELINGDRSKNYPNKAEYVREGVAWINTGHIEPDGTLSTDSMHYITRKKFDSLRSGKVRPGDLVYCLRGATLGKTAIITQFDEGAVASSLVIVRLSPAVDPRFAYRVLTSPLGREQIFQFDNGSAQPNLSAKNVKKYWIPIPPLAEQLRIVAKINQLMALVDQLEAQLTTSRAAAEKLMQAVVAELTSQPEGMVA